MNNEGLIQIGELLRRAIGQQTEETTCEIDIDSYTQRRAERYNKEKGKLNLEDGYNCNKCLNRGNTMRAVKIGGMWYERFDECSCMKVRRSIARMKASGLEKSIRDQRLDTFKAEKPWQKAMLEAAKAYIAEGVKAGAWLYIGGQAGCVDADTEYFNGKEWKRIADYSGENVLAYDSENGTARLVAPQRYIKTDAQELYEIKTLRGSISQVLSPNHNFAYITTKGHMQKKRFEDVIKLHNSSVQGFYGRIATTFDYSGDGIELTDREIRLMCAVIADGNFSEKLKLCRVNIKKERKKERMRQLLEGTDYKEHKKRNGYSSFSFYAPRREKVFSEYWYKCNDRQFKVIVDEIFNWDGSINGKRKCFFSTEKQSSDFVQFALATCGIRSTINIDRHRKKPCYVVIASSGKPTVTMVCTGGRTKAKIDRYEPVDGKQYCFTVETGYLVLRRNGRIFITGNSGKTHICTAVARELLYAGYEVRYVIWEQVKKELKAVINEPEYAEKMSKLESAEVLYIDDLFKPIQGAEPTKADMQIAFELFNYRYANRMPTMISSELFCDDIYAIDQATEGRIRERCGDRYNVMIEREDSRNLRRSNIKKV